MTFQVWNTKHPQLHQKTSPQLSRLIRDSYHIPFWIADKEKHKEEAQKKGRHCCFNHLIGLPQKNGVDFPIFDYEILVVNTILQNHNIWIKKARGLGITEIVLRYLAWASLSTSLLHNKHIFIVSGTREDFANHLKERLERLFERKYPLLNLESKYTELWLNKTWIKVFPTRAVKDLRGYTDVAYLFIDEADFFDDSIHSELEDAINSYEEKSKGKIIMVSTPNKPGGLFEKIELDTSSKYQKLFLDYTYGMNTIYDTQFIEREKIKPYFDREYNLKYLGKVGNLFSLQSIDRAVALGEQYSPYEYREYSEKYIVADQGYSTSKFVIMVGEWNREHRQLRILHGEELQSPLFETARDTILALRKQYGNVLNIAIDATSRQEFCMSLKNRIGESSYWPHIKKKMDESKQKNIPLEKRMIVVPIIFNTESKLFMSAHTQQLLDDPRNLVAINPKFNNLILSLKAAQFDDRGLLDKDESIHNDWLDAFMMLCTFVKFKREPQ
jgi:hypothetical protein